MHFKTRKVRIDGVDGTFYETTDVPPWPGTSTTTVLTPAEDYQPERRPAVPLRLASLVVVLGFSFGLFMGIQLPAWIGA